MGLSRKPIIDAFAPPRGPSEADIAEQDILALNEETELEAAAGLALGGDVFLRTPEGDAPITELAPGAMLDTLDDGPVRILAIEDAPPPPGPPVVVKAGAFGALRDTALGPERRVFYRGGPADVLFGAPEVLIEARHLPERAGASEGDWPYARAPVALSLERSALIWVNGVLVENGATPLFAAARPVLKVMEAAALFAFSRTR